MDQLAVADVTGQTPYSSAARTRSVSQRSEVFQPTIRLEKASRTAVSQNASSPTGIRVTSATHSLFGRIGVEVPLDQIRCRPRPQILSCGPDPPLASQECALQTTADTSAAPPVCDRYRYKDTTIVGCPGLPESRSCQRHSRRARGIAIRSWRTPVDLLRRVHVGGFPVAWLHEPVPLRLTVPVPCNSGIRTEASSRCS